MVMKGRKLLITCKLVKLPVWRVHSHCRNCRRGYPSAVILIQTRSFSSSDMNTQLATSTTLRPQPRHISSKVVEQTATHGVSGREEFCIMGVLKNQ